MNKEKLKALLPLVGLIVFFYLVSQLLPREKVATVVTSVGWYGPIIFILFALIAAIFAPLSGTPLSLVGFHLYGHNVVFLLSIAGWISYVTNFAIARLWGRPAVSKFVGKQSLSKMDEFIADYGYASLFFIRMFGGSFHDFVSYAFGLTKMRFAPYIVISFAGSIPGTIIWYLISLQADSALVFMLLTFLIGAVFSGLFVLWKRLTQKV